MTLTGINSLSSQWQILYQRYQKNIQECMESGEFDAESFRLYINDLFLTLTMKKDTLLSKASTEQEKEAIREIAALADYINHAVYGLHFYELYQEFCVAEPDPQKYIDNPILYRALTSDLLRPIIKDIQNIFDPIACEPMIRALQLEEENIKGRVLLQLEEGAITRTEGLELLVFLKNLQREALGHKTYDCHVKDITQFSNTVRKATSANEDTRFQVLLHNLGHYTAVECRVKNGKKQAIIMDAAQDARREEACKALEQQGFEVTLCGNPEGTERVQFDTVNCSFFSYDHLINSSRMDDFFELLEQAPHNIDHGRKHVSWKDMPGVFIRNAQSVTYLKKAYQENPSLPASPVALNENESPTKGRRMSVLHRYLDVNAEQTPEGKRLQKGISRVRTHVKHKAEKYLQNLSDDDLIKLFYGTKEDYVKLLADMKAIEEKHQQFLDVLDELSDRSSSYGSSSDSDYDSESTSRNSSPSSSRSQTPTDEIESAILEGQDTLQEVQKTIQQRAQELQSLLSERLSPKLERSMK